MRSGKLRKFIGFAAIVLMVVLVLAPFLADSERTNLDDVIRSQLPEFIRLGDGVTLPDTFPTSNAPMLSTLFWFH